MHEWIGPWPPRERRSPPPLRRWTTNERSGRGMSPYGDRYTPSPRRRRTCLRWRDYYDEPRGGRPKESSLGRLRQQPTRPPFVRSQRPRRRARPREDPPDFRYSSERKTTPELSNERKNHHHRAARPLSRHLVWSVGMQLRPGLRAVGELGTGTFGRVLECIDDATGEAVAVKVVKNGKEYADAAAYEADILKCLKQYGSAASQCIRYIDSFLYQNSHFCLVTEKLGMSLFEFLDRNRMRPFLLPDIQVIAQDITLALVFLKEIELTHTDLKLENVLFVDPFNQKRGGPDPKSFAVIREDGTWRDFQRPDNAHVRVADFGGGTFDRDEHCPLINTRQYRAPEVILNLGWNESSDIWSFGCMLFELYTGRLLFRTHDHLEHLHLIVCALGPIPVHMLKRASTTEGRAYVDRYDQRCYLRQYEGGPRPCVSRMSDQLSSSCQQFISFVQHLLIIDPDQRPTPREILKHPFLKMRLNF